MQSETGTTLTLQFSYPNNGPCPKNITFMKILDDCQKF
jgi:hypothetical protein